MYDVLVKHTQKNHEEFPIFLTGSRGASCRFCKSKDVTFNTRAHSVPEFLGNKSMFTLDECDVCNSFFGQKIERELSEFVPPSWFTRLRGKKGYRKSQSIGGTKLFSDSNFINIKLATDSYVTCREFETKGRSFSNVNVYKAWVKILVSVIPRNYLPDFDETITWRL